MILEKTANLLIISINLIERSSSIVKDEHAVYSKTTLKVV